MTIFDALQKSTNTDTCMSLEVACYHSIIHKHKAMQVTQKTVLLTGLL